MFLIYDKKTREAVRCHGTNSAFDQASNRDLKKDLHLKDNEDFIRLTNTCIHEIRSKAFHHD
ncbi:hypothetical protein HZI73_04560 [Vallitalea pronyensis]|uniref:Uncharacterized protein n=1 Tax=Vallitalea pronyensis TaxID=1348613 RepID=A0A8J8MI20_9FIRM|nr:hypothetical protein [Vallitalea pronyensis]QUI21608.1 hypothetical protein HZI73_04560 [Vallitalea pronyensis]